jgi:Zn-dependent peptidase ImmA (M78 family)
MRDKKIRTALQRTYVNYQEWARENSIFHTFSPLNPEVYGFVYLSSFHKYFIIINKNLTKELQKEVFLHEVEHIIYDMPELGYIIGLDMQHSSIEKKADKFATLMAANFFT